MEDQIVAIYVQTMEMTFDKDVRNNLRNLDNGKRKLLEE
jgi:hypothetical protein